MSLPDFYPRITIRTQQEAEDNRMFVATVHDMDEDVSALVANHDGATHAAASITLVFKSHEEP